MLTIFSIPKPFNDHIAVIQENAIRSWLTFEPECEVILFGDEEGTAQFAQSLGVRHVPDVSRNENGTPMVDDLFSKARELAARRFLCYINSDIVMLGDLLRAVKICGDRFDRYLMIGRRWDVQIETVLDFTDGNWEQDVANLVETEGKLHAVDGIDYFVFSRDLYEKVPPFAIGRSAWDNWLVYHAVRKKVPVIDATWVVRAVHQNHEYSHPDGKRGIWTGSEAEQNREIAGGLNCLYRIDHATHTITRKGKIHKRMPMPFSIRNQWLSLKRVIGYEPA